MNDHITQSQAEMLAEDIIYKAVIEFVPPSFASPGTLDGVYPLRGYQDALDGVYTLRGYRDMIGQDVYARLIQETGDLIYQAAQAHEDGRFGEWFDRRNI